MRNLFFLLFTLLLVSLIAYYSQKSTEDIRNEDELTQPKIDNYDSESSQTILLTGFEPFGGAEENASWEGVKNLDGVDIVGYRIVVKRLQVVWGKPVIQLQEFVDEVKPKAVFSFGQGKPEGFKIESVAVNKRDMKLDNNGSLPGSIKTIPDGKDEYGQPKSNTLVSRLLVRDFPVSISKDPGKYLCEECLYSLLYLREKRYPKLDVFFTHVPPIGTKLKSVSKPVTPEYIADFVTAMVEEWAKGL